MVAFLLLNGLLFSQEDTLVVHAVQVQNTNKHDRFEETIEKYQAAENWRLWSFPFDSLSSSVNAQDLQNLSDEDLTTAWLIDLDSLDSVPAKIQVEMVFPEAYFYAAAYQFCGEVNVFNGVCSSHDTWEQFARIKTMSVSYNGQFLCVIELLDTWHLQSFDISRFFKNDYLGKNLEKGIAVHQGDLLEFEIIDFYYGHGEIKAAISEFLMEGAKN